MSDYNYKTLEYMTKHFENIKSMAPALFYTSINDLSIMANGGNLAGERSRLYGSSYHTDKFFADLLQNLGYNKDGNKIKETK